MNEKGGVKKHYDYNLQVPATTRERELHFQVIQLQQRYIIQLNFLFFDLLNLNSMYILFSTLMSAWEALLRNYKDKG